jgi:hypothetical protein
MDCLRIRCLPTAWWLILLVSMGCSPTGVQPVATRGVVKTRSGEPCNGALVVFHPTEKDRLQDAKPVATADASGNFVLTTFALNDGALPGEYGVTVVWPGESTGGGEFSLSSESNSSQDRLGGRYGDPRTPVLRVTIPSTGSEPIELQVE